VLTHTPIEVHRAADIERAVRTLQDVCPGHDHTLPTPGAPGSAPAAMCGYGPLSVCQWTTRGRLRPSPGTRGFETGAERPPQPPTNHGRRRPPSPPAFILTTTPAARGDSLRWCLRRPRCRRY
jgi:hypothetical protein